MRERVLIQQTRQNSDSWNQSDELKLSPLCWSLIWNCWQFAWGFYGFFFSLLPPSRCLTLSHSLSHFHNESTSLFANARTFHELVVFLFLWQTTPCSSMLWKERLWFHISALCSETFIWPQWKTTPPHTHPPLLCESCSEDMNDIRCTTLGWTIIIACYQASPQIR